MIMDPSQYQIKQAEQNGDTIIAKKKPFWLRVFDFFMHRLVGFEPNYITYKDEIYDNRLVIIYTKEEVGSFKSDIFDTIYFNTKIPAIEQKRKIKIAGNINLITLDLGKYSVKLDYDDLFTFLQIIQNNYERLKDNPTFLDYNLISRSTISSYKDNSYTYEFLKGFVLELQLFKNKKTGEYMVVEDTFGLKSNDFKTEKEAYDQMSDLLKTKIDISLENPLLSADQLIKRKRIGEDTSLEI